MTGTGNSPKGRRWWETGDRTESAGGGYGHLVTGGRGRSRPDRSLSVGTDPVDEPARRHRGLLWPAACVVAVGALIVGGVYGVPMVTSPSADSTESQAAPIPRAAQRSGDMEPFQPSAPPGELPGGGLPGGGDQLPEFTVPGFPGGAPSAAPGGMPDGGAGGTPGGGAGDPSGGSGEEQSSDPDDSADSGSNSPSTTPTVESDGPAPAAPGPQRGGPTVRGKGGCAENSCTVAQDAPVFLAGTSEPRAKLPAGRYPFLCQSSGSTYSVGDRTSDWWAWLGSDSAGAWVPVVFLDDAPDDGPVPGLPKCGSAPESSAPESSAPPASPSKRADAPTSATPASPSNDGG